MFLLRIYMCLVYELAVGLGLHAKRIVRMFAVVCHIAECSWYSI